jgi:hypothetical protein
MDVARLVRQATFVGWISAPESAIGVEFMATP